MEKEYINIKMDKYILVIGKKVKCMVLGNYILVIKN